MIRQVDSKKNILGSNIGYMTLTGLLGLVGAFSHDRYKQ